MLEELKIFLEVASLGNFSKAAKANDVAVSSITRRIDYLETEFGAKLFNRGSRMLLLTDAGEKLLPRARLIVAEISEARDALSAVQPDPRGVLSVTAPATFGRHHIAPAVGSFLQKYPLLEVDLHVSDDIVDLVTERVDIAIRIGVLPDSSLLATHLAPQRRVACASPEYLARAGTPGTPADLMQHNCLTVRSPPARVGWWRFDGIAGNKPLPIRGSFRCSDSDALLQATISGLGVAHLATWLVSEEIAAGRLIALFPPEPNSLGTSTSAIHAVRVPGRASAKTKLFIEHLKTEFGVADGGNPYWEKAFATRLMRAKR